MRITRSERGFTLIEVLLSLALTALLLVLLSGGVFVVARDWNSSADGLETKLDEALVITQIERALLAAFPHSYSDPETLVREIYFDGEADRLSWASTVSPNRQPGLTAWALDTSAREGIELRLAPAYSDDPTQRLEDTEPRLVLAGYELSVDYLREPNDTQREWVDEWSGLDEAALPLAVRLLFTARDSSRSDYEVVAPIKAWRHRSIMPRSFAQGAAR